MKRNFEYFNTKYSPKHTYGKNFFHILGLKTLCHEGGCGSCVVSISKNDPVAKPESIMAVNSVSFLSLKSWPFFDLEH